MNYVNTFMTGLGYFTAATIALNFSLKGYLRLKLWRRKRQFEKLHGKHSYGAVTYLAGIKKSLEDAGMEMTSRPPKDD